MKMTGGDRGNSASCHPSTHYTETLRDGYRGVSDLLPCNISGSAAFPPSVAASIRRFNLHSDNYAREFQYWMPLSNQII
ncbi:MULTISPECIES: hypothetical protein [Herbaspirillum]|jgi:hypothetical protein|uniref:hypothetical protein n=1 Tax=Herbaspirillum TaxID=963 RepID=UPI00257CDBA9|nr:MULTISPECIES: hypothetical protein [unclassified Herbaspirillum]MCP3654080.1 hypothetical protein [Herbaspirillum sp.]